MNEKKLEERLRNDADTLREKFSPEIHRGVMNRLLLKPELLRKSRKAMDSWWWLAVETGVAVLIMVVFGLRPQGEVESEPKVVPPQSSEVVQFFAPCGEPIRVVAQTVGVELPSISDDEEILLPEKEQLDALLESTRMFVNEQVTWVLE